MTAEIYYPNSFSHPDFVITQIDRELDPEFNFEDVSEIAGSAVFPGFTGSESNDPKLDFSTTQVKTVLDACTIEGVVNPNGDEPVILDWKRGQNLGARAANNAGNHISMTAGNSLFYWKGISAGEKGMAKIDCCWRPVSVSGNPPWVLAFNHNITNLPTVEHLYRLGPVTLTYLKLGGSNVTITICNDGWTWANNIVERNKMCSGANAPIYASIGNVVPTVEVTTDNLAQPLGLAPHGASIVSASFYLRKLTPGGIDVPPGTAQHIKLTSTVGSVKPMGSKKFKFQLHSFTKDTASTIPT
jgi:hypothetical protein